MNRLLLILFAILLFGCAPKIVYIPVETIRTIKEVVKDTIVEVRNVPSFDSIRTLDTLSIIDRKTAKTTAKISRGILTHTLEVKDVPIKVKFQYIQTTIHDTTTKLMPINKADQKKLDGYDKLQEKSKSRGSTIWKLIGIISLLTLWTFRKLLLKLVKPL